MLSPHEIATLVLLCGNSQPRDLDTVDVETLLALQLLTLERPSPGVSEPRVTLPSPLQRRAIAYGSEVRRCG